tara:strand:+ start:12340 stop:13635 length:1296 start_codon:yes stop_codon:yes gene_type:complete
MSSNDFNKLKDIISKERKIVKEMSSLLNRSDIKDKMVSKHIKSLKDSLKKENKNLSGVLAGIFIAKPLPQVAPSTKELPKMPQTKDLEEKNEYINKKLEEHQEIYPSNLEDKTLIKLSEKAEISMNKERKSRRTVRFSNKLFSGLSTHLIEREGFKKLQRNLVKANMKFLSKIYISIMLFSTLLAFIISIFIFAFFLFFNMSSIPPFITVANENMMTRFLKFSWLLIAMPIGTFVFMYFYPAMTKASLERKINQELPFATINMAAISGSLIDPTRIFKIIILTKEYPNLKKEFIEIINGVNVLGYNLITVLRKSSFNSPSKKLGDLFNGLATTINSGGDLPRFFKERSKNLLFEYKIEQEKDTRTAETFMDIYISVVIAAPMILMLLMIMIQISGLGIGLSVSVITLIMIFGVSVINIIFLTFLHVRQPVD